MSTYKLTYFDVRGRAETARLLFALKGQEYKNEIIQNGEWPKLKPGNFKEFMAIPGYSLHEFLIYINKSNRSK